MIITWLFADISLGVGLVMAVLVVGIELVSVARNRRVLSSYSTISENFVFHSKQTNEASSSIVVSKSK